MIKQTNLKFSKFVSKRLTTNKVVLHHAAAKRCDAETIHRWHLSNGWAGIGYHFVVRKDGTIEQGRQIDSVGAHCTGHNGDSIGICFEGDFTEEKMSQTQINAGKELIKYIRHLYGQGIRICKHSDLYATSCPGKNFPFDEIVKKVFTKPLPTLPERGYFQEGDSGKEVAKLKVFLNWWGNFGLSEKANDKNKIGEKTVNAIMEFQKRHGLIADGLWGKLTEQEAKKYL